MTTKRSVWLGKARDATVHTLYMVAAAGCFGLSIYSIWLDRAASAAVAATFAVAFLFLKHLPIVESFKIFNLEAKFARRVDESERLLNQIRSVAVSSARLLYVQLGYANRMASISWGRKRELMEQMDSNLTALGVDRQFIETAKIPVLNFAVRDLFAIFRGTADALLRRHVQQLGDRMNAISAKGPIEAADPEWNELARLRTELVLPRDEFGDMSDVTRLRNVADLIQEVLARNWWTADDRSKLELVATEVQKLAADCWNSGTVTPEAETYIEQYGSRIDDRLKELEHSAEALSQ